MKESDFWKYNCNIVKIRTKNYFREDNTVL